MQVRGDRWEITYDDEDGTTLEDAEVLFMINDICTG